MPTLDVILPKTKEPLFPKRCACCGDPKLDGYFKEISPEVSFRSFFGLSKSGHSFNVPVCKKCNRRMLYRKWVEFILAFIFFYIGSVVGYVACQFLGLTRNRLIESFFGILALVPLVIITSFIKLGFDVIVAKDMFVFEFSNRDYADEFARMNMATIEEEC